MSQADDMVTALYGSQYRSLVRLAVLLGGEDVRAAEEITQASFVALHGTWPRLRDHEAAIAFLRRAVVSRSRQPGPRGPVAPGPTAATGPSATTAPTAAVGLNVTDGPTTTDGPAAQSADATADPAAPGAPADSRIMTAVRALPCRQREAVVLRLFLNLPDRQAAAAMGVTTGALRDHTARAMTALRPVL